MAVILSQLVLEIPTASDGDVLVEQLSLEVSNSAPTAVVVIPQLVLEVVRSYHCEEPPPPVAPSGGIYILVPGKRSDTLWSSFDPDEEIEVKIPNPTIKTGLIGE